MIRWQTQELTGWGRTARVQAPCAAIRDITQVQEAAMHTPHLLAHGLGRSYGDVALPDETGQALLMPGLDQLTSFDEQSGILVAAAGVSLKTLLEVFAPRGWLVPVLPGTSYVTLGGALANDVHGKNHLSAGALSRHVLWLEIVTANGQLRRFSRTQEPEYFFATLGGLGLTGVIVRAALQLQKIPGQVLAVTQHRCRNLAALLQAFESLPAADPYAVAWLDALADGTSLGRGIFERAHFIKETAPITLTPRLSLPMDFPEFVLNPFTVGLFNRLRYAAVGRAKPTTRAVPLTRFFFPLDRIGQWNRLYGQRGFYQFQCAVPQATAERALTALLQRISASTRASFLAVLKRFGGPDDSLLGFAMPGYTLALDFPAGSGTPELIAALIAITRQYEGRVYLAKDALLTADDFAAMYPALPRYRAALAALDPEQKFCSRLRARLQI